MQNVSLSPFGPSRFCVTDFIVGAFSFFIPGGGGLKKRRTNCDNISEKGESWVSGGRGG